MNEKLSRRSWDEVFIAKDKNLMINALNYLDQNNEEFNYNDCELMISPEELLASKNHWYRLEFFLDHPAGGNKNIPSIEKWTMMANYLSMSSASIKRKWAKKIDQWLINIKDEEF